MKTGERDAGQDLAHDPVGDERRQVSRPELSRGHLDDVGANELQGGCEGTAGPEQIDGRHAAGLRGSRTGGKRRVEDVHVDRQEHGPGPDSCERAFDDDSDPELADLAHRKCRDPVLGLPGELGLAGPVTAKADLHVAARIDQAALDEPVHRRAVRELDTEDLRARVGVRVEMDEPNGTRDRGARPHVRLRDRVVAAEHHRQNVCCQHFPHCALDRGVGKGRVCRHDRRVAEVDDAELGQRVYPHLHAGAGLEACSPDSSRAEASPGPIGDELVHRRAENGDVHALEVRHLFCPGHPGVGGEPRVIGLPEAAPAPSRVEHAPMLRGTRQSDYDARRSVSVVSVAISSRIFSSARRINRDTCIWEIPTCCAICDCVRPS
jgi:hypothetical protein